MTKYLWCALLIVTAYGSLCAVAWAERFEWTERYYGDGGCTTGIPAKCWMEINEWPLSTKDKTEKDVDCLAKMEAAMRAYELAVLDIMQELQHAVRSGGHVDPELNASQKATMKLWESTKRECWATSPGTP